MNRRIKVILGLILFLYFGVYLFSLTFSRRTNITVHEKIVVAIASPLQNLVDYSFNKARSIFSDYFFLVYASKENEKLTRENQELQQDVIHMHEIQLENDRLISLLNLTPPKKFGAVYAEKIAFGSNEFERTIRLNKGSNDHLAVGMPVMNSQGVVGQIAEVFPSYSNVLLLTDKTSAIDIMIQRTRARSILRGYSYRQLSFEFLSVEQDVQEGDVIVSSGLDGVYPEGIPVGKVSAVGKQGRRLFLSGTVDPYVDFSTIEEVRVILTKEGG